METVKKVTTSEIQAERRETEKKSNVQYVSNLAQVVGALYAAGRQDCRRNARRGFIPKITISALKLPGIYMP